MMLGKYRRLFTILRMAKTKLFKLFDSSAKKIMADILNTLLFGAATDALPNHHRCQSPHTFPLAKRTILIVHQIPPIDRHHSGPDIRME